MTLNVVHGDALKFLRSEPAGKYDLIYIDPPFNTGQRQVSKRDANVFYEDCDDPEEYGTLMSARLCQAQRVLKESGTIYIHIDERALYHFKLYLDARFGWNNFLNHVIWSYNFGGRGRNRWPQKHDDILVYTKCQGKHIFNWDEIERIPYKAPEMQRVGRSPEDAERRIALGQVPTDVWDMSIVGTNSKERTGYPTQKPVALVKRAIVASTPPGGLVLDFFAGSGTTGEAALQAGRSCTLVDSNLQAIEVMKKRFGERATFTEHSLASP